MKAQYTENNEFIVLTLDDGSTVTVPNNSERNAYSDVLDTLTIEPYEEPTVEDATTVEEQLAEAMAMIAKLQEAIQKGS